jgi:hypothetical protein
MLALIPQQKQLKETPKTEIKKEKEVFKRFFSFYG